MHVHLFWLDYNLILIHTFNHQLFYIINIKIHQPHRNHRIYRQSSLSTFWKTVFFKTFNNQFFNIIHVKINQPHRHHKIYRPSSLSTCWKTDFFKTFNHQFFNIIYVKINQPHRHHKIYRFTRHTSHISVDPASPFRKTRHEPTFVLRHGDTSPHLKPGHVASGQEASLSPDLLCETPCRRHRKSRTVIGTFQDLIEHSSISSGIRLAALTAPKRLGRGALNKCVVHLYIYIYIFIIKLSGKPFSSIPSTNNFFT